MCVYVCLSLSLSLSSELLVRLVPSVTEKTVVMKRSECRTPKTSITQRGRVCGRADVPYNLSESRVVIPQYNVTKGDTK